MKKKKIILAFSGGLDTSFCVQYLSREKQYEVHSVTVNTGGFSTTELQAIAQHAKKLGVASHKNIDETKNYYDSVIKYLVFGNVLKNNTYPLSVSAERMSQALCVAQYAKKMNINSIAHGSTGAGNDQVRFDMVFQTLLPGVEIITPIRDLKLSRQEEIDYLKKNGVTMNFAKAQYSINKGMWGTSIGGKETLHSMGNLPETAYTKPLTKKDTQEIDLHFVQGELFQIGKKKFKHPTEAIFALEDMVNGYGIGRDIHVGDTIIGIKGRVGFEAAAPLIILKAHHLLEKHVLTKWQLTWKETLSQFYGNWLHEGQYMDPVMRNIEQFLQDTQQNVTGLVKVKIKPQHFELLGIDSKHDLMNAKFGQYGEENKMWTGEDVRGFSKIFGNQTMLYHLLNQGK